jgi:carboxylate-amine ligase
VAAYDEVTGRLVAWGAALDEAMIYLPARLSNDYPTVEVRVADVCTDLDDTVLVAALTRALVATVAAEQPQRWRSELLGAASWRAARYGVGDRLVDPVLHELAPARQVIGSLVDHVRPALEEAGDLDLVEALVERLLATGNGAIRQRRRYESSGGSLTAVVEDVLHRTRESWSG